MRSSGVALLLCGTLTACASDLDAPTVVDANERERLDATPSDGAETSMPDGAAGTGDAEPSRDAETSDGMTPCLPNIDAVDTSSRPPERLSLTGLFVDIDSKTLAPGVEPYSPRYALWSDGAAKLRWVRLPDCAPIHTQDMDHWSLPVGTRLWKEFVVEGIRVETRMITRFGPGPNDYSFAAYAWDEDESDAHLAPLGVTNARGTRHDIPSRVACLSCHERVSERVLGFSAIQLSHEGTGVTISALSRAGRLTMPSSVGFSAPGDALTQEALGYMHANCGHCHNDGVSAVQFPHPFSLRLSTADVRVDDTGAFRTAVGVAVDRFAHPGITHRIVRGTPAASCVAYRMSVRNSTERMPPIASELRDETGLAAIQAWIESL